MADLLPASVVLRYWPRGEDVPVAAWLTLFTFTILIINFLGIRFFGEVSYCLLSVMSRLMRRSLNFGYL